MDSYKISLLGEITVGKSTLVAYLKKNVFIPELDSTIGMHFMPLKYKDIQLNLWDTSGQERYQNITKLYYRNSVVIMLVYDLANNFESGLKYYLEEIKINTDNYKILLIGNKKDLIDDNNIVNIDNKVNDIIKNCDLQDKILDHVKISCKNLEGRDIILDKLYNYCKNNYIAIEEPIIILNNDNVTSSYCSC
ncbi:Ras family GTPase [Hokovirus HKV1]|uniref:Ras family GTPase n=1 Tax=Hokovirus HKV1 TaxID=1977638 RepID=A0A1V0SFX6_9VIRU|nr:Ras family GTPase [Hokovirus HKV1]